jgi:prepilin-type N-terminal cleavage/methylation domain-containing protein
MPKHDKNGFTLIELMVALALALAVTAAALGVMLTAIKTQQEGTLRAELARDAQFLMDTMARDLAYLGAGVPRGFESDPSGDLIGIGNSTYNASNTDLAGEANNQLRPAIRIGEAEYLAFLGDLPYPNADLNGIAGTSQMPLAGGGNTSINIGVTSELSPCTPDTGGGYDCKSTDESYIRNVGGNDCSDSAVTEPTCPWGMNKWQLHNGTDVPLVFTGVDGSWFRRAWDLSSTDTTNSNGRTMISLSSTPSGTGGVLPFNRFLETDVGGGTVSQLDRVFWSLEQMDNAGTACGTATPGNPCTLWRRQCWGWDLNSTHPSSPSFPQMGRAGSSHLTGATAPLDCAPGSDEGTGWEEVMGDVTSFTMNYFAPNAVNAALAQPLTAQTSAQTKVIEIDFTMERPIPGDRDGRTLSVRMHRRFWLENAGGLVTYPDLVPEVNGGCLQSVVNECSPQ